MLQHACIINIIHEIDRKSNMRFELFFLSFEVARLLFLLGQVQEDQSKTPNSPKKLGLTYLIVTSPIFPQIR